MFNAIYKLLTISVLLLLTSCGIKWATNRVLSNPDAIAKVGAVYDALTPRDTTERLVFIPGDSVIIELTDTAYLNKTDTLSKTDTIRIRTVRNIRTVDTIIRKIPPDNRAMARLLDSLGVYTNELNKAKGTIAANNKALKTAENRLIWMAAVLLLAGVVIGVLVKLKIIPKGV